MRNPVTVLFTILATRTAAVLAGPLQAARDLPRHQRPTRVREGRVHRSARLHRPAERPRPAPTDRRPLRRPLPCVLGDRPEHRLLQQPQRQHRDLDDDRAGLYLRQLTNIAFATFPDYSPRAGRIAFDGEVAGDLVDEVFLRNSDRSDLRQLTSGSGNNDRRTWSPDGRRLAFISDRTGIEQVYTMRPDGARQTQLTFQPLVHDQLPDWRADGRELAHTQGDPGVNEKIWVMNANGSAQHQVSGGTADDFGPTRSPDGRKFAFVRDFLNGDRPVMMMNAHGGDALPVDDPTGSVIQCVPAWRPR